MADLQGPGALRPFDEPGRADPEINQLDADKGHAAAGQAADPAQARPPLASGAKSTAPAASTSTPEEPPLCTDRPTKSGNT
jgi:cell division septation protein DedD